MIDYTEALGRANHVLELDALGKRALVPIDDLGYYPKDFLMIVRDKVKPRYYTKLGWVCDSQSSGSGIACFYTGADGCQLDLQAAQKYADQLNSQEHKTQ